MRLKEGPLFLASFDKVEGKMRAFGMDVSTLRQNVGFVKKNPENVVIGLVKTGLKPTQALGVYHSARQGGHARVPPRNLGELEGLTIIRRAGWTY